MNKFEIFRNENPVFVFKSYNIKENDETIDIEFSFEIPELAQFSPGWSFPKPAGLTVSGDRVFEN